MQNGLDGELTQPLTMTYCMGAIRSGGMRMQTAQRPILDLTSPALSVACNGRSNCAAGSIVAILGNATPS